MKEWKKKIITLEKKILLEHFFCGEGVLLRNYRLRYSQRKMAVGLGSNGVMNFGHLFVSVTLTGRVTGAESRSKCGHSA